MCVTTFLNSSQLLQKSLFHLLKEKTRLHNILILQFIGLSSKKEDIFGLRGGSLLLLVNIDATKQFINAEDLHGICKIITKLHDKSYILLVSKIFPKARSLQRCFQKAYCNLSSIITFPRNWIYLSIQLMLENTSNFARHAKIRSCCQILQVSSYLQSFFIPFHKRLS